MRRLVDLPMQPILGPSRSPRLQSAKSIRGLGRSRSTGSISPRNQSRAPPYAQTEASARWHRPGCFATNASAPRVSATDDLRQRSVAPGLPGSANRETEVCPPKPRKFSRLWRGAESAADPVTVTVVEGNELARDDTGGLVH